MRPFPVTQRFIATRTSYKKNGTGNKKGQRRPERSIDAPNGKRPGQGGQHGRGGGAGRGKTAEAPAARGAGTV